ncbi:hypothetical protein [Granulicella aggregans]|uniref:hypothetical protein n=1 Tax=Granulicella aggregans TaxID=474949 RepID=UPI0021E0C994|nr:hypothetical protein [Granulicella aggregans]
MRLKRAEQVGLLTCMLGHHSLLLDSRDYWADILEDGRPKLSRCRCGNNLFKVELRYDFRDEGEVRSIEVTADCSACARPQAAALFETKYAPTDHLVARPLDPIERPWFQPKRQELTSLWIPQDAERFAKYLVEELDGRAFSSDTDYDYRPRELRDICFYPELTRDVLFTNVPDIVPASKERPENSSPFLRLSSPYHMHYSAVFDLSRLESDVCLLYSIRFSEEVIADGELLPQPPPFLEFTRLAVEWLRANYVSLRGKRTADNLQEHLRADRLRFPEKFR